MRQRPLIVKILLFPFMLIYGLVVFVRNFLFGVGLLKQTVFDIPLISVGNITVGGTGKTPHVEYLVAELRKSYSVAVLSRGYKRKTSGFVCVRNDSEVEDVGDEPLQIKQKFADVAVAVDERRRRGIKRLMTNYPGLDVVILDDAFQHRYVKPGLSILLVDYNRPLSKDQLLPVGRLREPARAKQRASIVIVTKSPYALKPIDRRIVMKELDLYPFQSLYFTTYSYGTLTRVFSPHELHKSEEELKKSKPNILMVTGIATPRYFKKYLRGISTNITTLSFPDHHRFTRKDIRRIIATFNNIEGENKIIITTEKDAVRLRKFEKETMDINRSFYYVSVEVLFAGDEGERFNNKITRYVGKNKRNHLIYQE